VSPATTSRSTTRCHRAIRRGGVRQARPGAVLGAGCERIADAACSATTLRRRRDEWIALGVFDRLRPACRDADEQMIALDLADVAVDGCITKAPCGGDRAGRSPVDRGRSG
jgi:hypothetical protein